MTGKLLLLMIMIGSISCQSQTKRKMNDSKMNPLLCDTTTGICEVPGSNNVATATNIKTGIKPIKIIYYTDPICSSCWGIEPQLRKLKLEYGEYIDIDYRMGGLLPDWSYNSGGISKPSDVAHHWKEVSRYYEMPIEGDVWLTDPLHSSYPPSIAMKAAQMQDKTKAFIFLRKLRERVFLDNKNITRWEVIQETAEYAQLDVAQLKKDYEGPAKQLFEEDLQYARTLGVRGFPTLFVSAAGKQPVTIYGFRPYDVFENAVKQLLPDARKESINTTPLALFSHYPTLTLKEYAVLTGTTNAVATTVLDKLVAANKLKKQTLSSGSIYSLP